MTILLTGNKGYIGSVLGGVLTSKGYNVVGFDTDYYNGQELYPIRPLERQIRKDIRDIAPEDLKDIDGVIHLAALSNDPLGEFNSDLTQDINFLGTIILARLAKKAGVKRFIYSSSQSMYGIADTSHELTEDEAGPYGTTAYAKTKWEAEQELKKLSSLDFIVVCMRPSTVFGASPSLRCDIVFNNLLASAYTTGKIEIKSDGTPWRPVVHILDVSSALIAGLEAPKELVSGESFNVGIPNGNYTVKDLALSAQKAVSGSTLTFTGEHGADARTYRISFKKIFSVLKDYYKPQWNLDRGGKELVDLFKRVNFTEKQFNGNACNRLRQIRFLIDTHKLNADLRWIA